MAIRGAEEIMKLPRCALEPPGENHHHCLVRCVRVIVSAYQAAGLRGAPLTANVSPIAGRDTSILNAARALLRYARQDADRICFSRLCRGLHTSWRFDSSQSMRVTPGAAEPRGRLLSRKAQNSRYAEISLCS